MRLLPFLAALIGLAFAGAAQAAQVARVDVRGLDEVMAENVRQSLSLVDAIGDELSGRRLDYLVREAADEAREALEPFGYYDARIDVRRADVRGGTGITVDVAPGEPVRVRESHVAVDGPARDDALVREALDAFEPTPGDVLLHPLYEAGKSRISGALAAHGYFDAQLERHRVEVTRADHAADIDLAWSSGDPYAMGEVRITQTPQPVVHDRLLHKLVYWDAGSPYRQEKIDRLRESLRRLDYFSTIDIEVDPDAAIDRRVPIEADLTPAKRSIYTAGLSYGTDSGAGVRLGVERRYLNMRGHKALAELQYAQQRKTLTLQYRIPAFAWLDGWYTFSGQAADEQTDYVDNRRVELVASRSGEFDRRLTVTASLHALRERWAYEAEDDGDPATPPDYRYATFNFPSLRAEYVQADDRLQPRDGIGATLLLRGGSGRTDDEPRASFAQVHATARWYRGLGPRSRLITRGEIGHTFVDTTVGTLPPSLRFHAGGERSIRGYGWREVGPRIGPPGARYPVGARNVVTGSVEYEQYFSETWGAAVFVDSGSAFNDSPEWRTGVGVGVRWRSPVGPVRVDIARGLDNPDSRFQLTLSIGAEL